MKNISDVLIIGSGIAGLGTAIRIAEAQPEKSIHVLTKVETQESNTQYAQGGVAAVWDLKIDNFKKHVEDTLDAGDDLSNPEVVKMVVEEGPQRVQDLIEWGANFDKSEDGDYSLGMEVRSF